MNIIEFMEHPDIMGTQYTGKSWEAMKSVLSGAFCVPMSAGRLKLFKRLAGHREPPTEQVSELHIIASRRSGKTDAISAVAIYLATVGVSLTNQLDKLSAGENAYISIIAPDRDQANLLIAYIKGKLLDSPVLAPMIDRVTTDSIELNNKVIIKVNTATFRAVRGKSNLAIIIDEACFLRSENSANVDEEIYRAATPSLATLKGMVICISSPYSRKGLMFRKYQKHFGQNTSTLVVQGGVYDFNPTIDPQIIADAIADDPESAASEWLGQWREGISDFIDRQLIESLCRPCDRDLPYNKANYYVAFVDPAGGGKDHYTLAIAHKDQDGLVIIDVLRGELGTPAEITQRFAQLINEYRAHIVEADRYAGSWPSDEYRKHRVNMQHCELNKSEIYRFALPVLRNMKAELPYHKTMVNEFSILERTALSGGKERIDHPKGAAFHDDYANAVCGAIYLASKQEPLFKGRIIFSR